MLISLGFPGCEKKKMYYVHWDMDIVVSYNITTSVIESVFALYSNTRDNTFVFLLFFVIVFLYIEDRT